jgi:hypothetical protein
MAANLTDEQRLKLQQIADRHGQRFHANGLREPTPEPSPTP